MNSTDTSPERTPEEQAAIRDFIATVKEANEGRAAFAKQAPEAMRRLARAVYGHDNSQAQTVAACLASIYNGSDARPVRLDEIRHLDWSLQKDLLAVMIGTGHSEFEDADIRKTFEEIGGQAAVDWFHWYTTGGPHRAALTRLIRFIGENRDASSGRALRDLLASIVISKNDTSLSRLGYIDDEHTKDFVLILDGLYGRDQGTLHVEDITEALKAAKLL
jgi:hypothetical protein